MALRARSAQVQQAMPPRVQLSDVGLRGTGDACSGKHVGLFANTPVCLRALFARD